VSGVVTSTTPPAASDRATTANTPPRPLGTLHEYVFSSPLPLTHVATALSAFSNASSNASYALAFIALAVAYASYALALLANAFSTPSGSIPPMFATKISAFAFQSSYLSRHVVTFACVASTVATVSYGANAHLVVAVGPAVCVNVNVVTASSLAHVTETCETTPTRRKTSPFVTRASVARRHASATRERRRDDDDVDRE
jgi:hypothetical protein